LSNKHRNRLSAFGGVPVFSGRSQVDDSAPGAGDWRPNPIARMRIFHALRTSKSTRFRSLADQDGPRMAAYVCVFLALSHADVIRGRFFGWCARERETERRVSHPFFFFVFCFSDCQSSRKNK
jgi:hypothetical protein